MQTFPDGLIKASVDSINNVTNTATTRYDKLAAEIAVDWRQFY